MGAKATYFLVFLAAFGVATRVTVSQGEQSSVIIVFMHTEHSLRNSSTFSSGHRQCAVFVDPHSNTICYMKTNVMTWLH